MRLTNLAAVLLLVVGCQDDVEPDEGHYINVSVTNPGDYDSFRLVQGTGRVLNPPLTPGLLAQNAAAMGSALRGMDLDDSDTPELAWGTLFQTFAGTYVVLASKDGSWVACGAGVWSAGIDSPRVHHLDVALTSYAPLGLELWGEEAQPTAFGSCVRCGDGPESTSLVRDDDPDCDGIPDPDDCTPLSYSTSAACPP